MSVSAISSQPAFHSHHARMGAAATASTTPPVGAAAPDNDAPAKAPAVAAAAQPSGRINVTA